MNIDNARQLADLVNERDQAEAVIDCLDVAGTEGGGSNEIIQSLAAEIKSWMERECLFDNDEATLPSDITSPELIAACETGAAFVINMLRAGAGQSLAKIDGVLATVEMSPIPAAAEETAQEEAA